jgi:hypothetical protein
LTNDDLDYAEAAKENELLAQEKLARDEKKTSRTLSTVCNPIFSYIKKPSAFA